MRIQHVTGRMRCLPLGVMSRKPHTAMGTTGALAIWAMMAKPPWTSTGWSSVRMRVPSGKMRMSSPRWSAWLARRSDFMSAVPRSTGMPPTRAKNQRTMPLWLNSDLKMGRRRRLRAQYQVTMTTTSAMEVWLLITTDPVSRPDRTFSAFSMRVRHMTHENAYRIARITLYPPRMMSG